MAPEELDEPLLAPVYRDILTTATSYYRWPKFDLYEIANDGLFARWMREFQVFQPSLYGMDKVKSAGIVRKVTSTKRSKLADKVSIHYDDDEEEDEPSMDLWTWCDRVRITKNTWGIVGCFDVELAASGTSPKGTTKYVHWQEAHEFMSAFTSKVPRFARALHGHERLSLLERNVGSVPGKGGRGSSWRG